MKKIVLFVLVAACVCKTTGSFAQVNVQDSLVLVDLYNSTGGPNWTNNTNWLTSAPISTWYGVYLNIDNITVGDLELGSNNLVGKIPDSLGKLTNPYSLLFHNNQLKDTIPSSIGNLSNLISIDFSYNQLTGSIPSSFGNFSQLQGLYLYNNKLNGSIPTSLGNLSDVVFFDLSYNQLTGNIPASFHNLPNLEILSLNDNQLSGSIPASSDSISNLNSLYLDYNEFTFAGMEGIANAYSGAVYAPQATIPLNYSYGKFSVSAGGTLTNDTFRLYRNDSLIATQVGDSVFTATTSGSYWVAVTNAIATQLTLYSDSMVLGADSVIMPAHPRIEYANRQFANANGWTDYYWDNNTPYDFTDDTLLLSLNTHGQNIGTLGDGTFAVKLAATAGAGSGMGIELTNPLITNPSGFWVMNRYWLVTPTTEPTANVGVRFYYNNQDLADVNGSYPTHNLTNQQLIFYKAIGGNPDPTTDLAGATGIISILNSTYASDTTWTYHQLTDTTQYAEFSVASFSGGGGGGTGNDQALPIKLLNFTATKEGSKNMLQWTTGQEVNSSYFEVERSGDGVNFTSIGQVDAAGNSTVAKNYSLVDAKPVNSMNYYRLKMMDKDGEFSYSQIRTINEVVSFAVSIYPNPVQDKLNLNFSSDKAETVQVVVLDNGGKVVAEQHIEVAAGASTQVINVGGLSSGVYYVRLVGSEGETEERFVKE